MALEIQRGRSKWWYGRVEISGKRLSKNLGVEIKGAIPPSLAEAGDVAFERSRAKAQAALEKLQLDMKRRSSAEELVQTLHEIRTGARIESISLSDMVSKWKGLPRRRPLSDSYVAQAQSLIVRFVEFVGRADRAAKDMTHVRATTARAFMKAEEERGVTPKTYNNHLIFLRALFAALRKEAGLAENPFDGIPTRDGETVFRKPFTVDELSLVLAKAREDEFIYPLVVTGVCTAMRRGDCCNLLRSSVDLVGGFVTVKTSKTTETVQIPIFPLLRQVLEPAMAQPSPRYVFPKLAAQYAANPDHVTDRVRRAMRAAGFFDADGAADDGSARRGEVSQEREVGLRRASVRDFHSFRVTWVTLALTAAVPLEVVQKVTGHRTTTIVMKHYFQPGREDFRRTLATKLPQLLVGAEQKDRENSSATMTDRLRQMDAKNWKQIRAELLAQLEGREPVASPQTVELESPRRENCRVLKAAPRHEVGSSCAVSPLEGCRD